MTRDAQAERRHEKAAKLALKRDGIERAENRADKDDQARQRLVEIALETAAHIPCPGCRAGECNGTEWRPLACAVAVRKLAGFKNPSTGSWCAAGLTAAMDKAGLLVPAPGTPARRGAIALLDFVAERPTLAVRRGGMPTPLLLLPEWLAPGDIIAWLQHPPPDPAGWRRGHVAVIVKVDDESLTTVGWNEGNAPGRVMMRRLWRSDTKQCGECGGSGSVMRRMEHGTGVYECEACRGRKVIARPRSSTVLWRRPGGLYGIARPVTA